ncbi:hypothetical protein CUC08_Gglean005697 [Alternaria sp. MG1]|nr:hypothetical protein CUC08_Gglean005697 [Alternaria sp. MG1]
MHQRTRSTQPIRAMPRTVARASPRTVATSLPTIHSIPNSVPATMQTQVRIQYLDEIEEVVSRLRRNSVRASHIDIPPDKPRVTFNIDQHTELIALIKQKSNEVDSTYT